MKKNKLIATLTSILFLSLILLKYHVPANTSNNISDNLPSVITQYITEINNGNYLDSVNYLKSETKEIESLIFSNILNIQNKVGILNIKNIDISDWIQTDDISPIQWIECEDYINNPSTKYYVIKASIELYNKDDCDYFIEGDNYFLYVISQEENSDKIFDIYALGKEIGKKYFNPISLMSNYDSPQLTNQLKWTTPSTINVLRKSTNTVEKINFKDYCRIVTANEFGNSSYDTNAK